MAQPLALIVDDEPDILELLELTLTRMGIGCQAAPDVRQARHLLEQRRFDLCLADLRLPDGTGIDLVRHIGEQYPALPVAIITAHGNMESAIQAMKAGAFDFVSKPVALDALRRLVQAALKLGNETRPPTPQSGILLGRSPLIEHVRQLIHKLARSQAPVYISGASGTGKELVARLIHAHGPRADRAFVAVNCGAIPEELMESELFGYRKGSFTGATGDKIGLFQAAEGGTLFLDEVADLPLPMQVKLLRAIQEKAVRPLGAPAEIAVDVRIISATHKNLEALVDKGEFRHDLFYRINVIDLPLPPLKDRAEDIPLLVEHFLIRIARQSGCPKPRIEPAALKSLQAYDFPGNVRELENILERAMALCDPGRIQVSDLRLPNRESRPALPPPPQPAAVEAKEHPGERVGPDSRDATPLEDYLGDIEKQAILKALEETHWNRTAAARNLGMSLRSLRYRLSKLGLD